MTFQHGYHQNHTWNQYIKRDITNDGAGNPIRLGKAVVVIRFNYKLIKPHIVKCHQNFKNVVEIKPIE
ncbi:hypothetical protein SDC9_206081 [bioreactor metagenome]|uniref:Uncharacterized protein n=1 Tax=bioreactor metagenome TaxID=1076179 RepID=A0A645J4K3_9ZZZZ